MQLTRLTPLKPIQTTNYGDLNQVTEWINGYFRKHNLKLITQTKTDLIYELQKEGNWMKKKRNQYYHAKVEGNKIIIEGPISRKPSIK